ncbi:MAG: hypothetical protein J5472_02755 [Clostridia bacterium]|nr:hypothetical protein [Clostridia bacterium]
MRRTAYVTPEGLVFVLLIYAVFFFCAHPIRQKMYAELICVVIGVLSGAAFFLWKTRGFYYASVIFFVASILMIPVHAILRERKEKKN